MHEVIKKIGIPVALILAIVGVTLAWVRSSSNASLTARATELRNQVQVAQFQVNIGQQNATLFQGIAQNLVQISQSQPAINPVLEQVGLKAPAKAAQATQAAPSGTTTTAPSPSRPSTR